MRGRAANKMPPSPVWTAIQTLLPMATPAKSLPEACPDMAVSQKLMPMMAS